MFGMNHKRRLGEDSSRSPYVFTGPLMRMDDVGLQFPYETAKPCEVLDVEAGSFRSMVYLAA